MPEKDGGQTPPPRPIKENLDWETCPLHGIKFPLGSSCPRCEVEGKG